MTTQKKYALLIVASVFLCLIVVGGIFASNKTVGVEHVVLLTKDGYQPKELRINQYDTVRFMTDRGEPFWPASDNHPAHSQNPDFDPKTSIEANNSWSFTFTKPGVYKYHDHLNSTLRGTIIVSEK